MKAWMIALDPIEDVDDEDSTVIVQAKTAAAACILIGEEDASRISSIVRLGEMWEEKSKPQRQWDKRGE